MIIIYDWLRNWKCLQTNIWHSVEENIACLFGVLFFRFSQSTADDILCKNGVKIHGLTYTRVTCAGIHDDENRHLDTWLITSLSKCNTDCHVNKVINSLLKISFFFSMHSIDNSWQLPQLIYIKLQSFIVMKLAIELICCKLNSKKLLAKLEITVQLNMIL